MREERRGLTAYIVPFLAGFSRMPYRRLFPYNALGAVLWAVSFVLLGYFVGEGWRLAERWIGRASIILGGALLAVLALAWLRHWAVRHEVGIKSRWAAFLDMPRMVRASGQFAPQIGFVRARLSPGNYLGLQLTLGVLVLLGAAWLFGGITEDVVTRDPLTLVDMQVARWLHVHAAPLLTQCMLVVTNLHGTIAISVYFLILALFLVKLRNWYWLFTALAAVPGGMLINVMVKHILRRPRPTFEHPLLTLTTYSFPSGHVAASTLFYGLLGAMLITKICSWPRRVGNVLAAFAVVILVAFSRIYLGVHYLSDVLGAFTEGLAWLAVFLTAMNTFRQRNLEQRRQIAHRPRSR